MADIRCLDENSIRQLITLVKASTESKLEVRWVGQLPITDIQNNIIYLIESGVNGAAKNCEAYLYLNNTIGWVKISGSDTQMDIMPMANAENKGKIVQYIGDTTTEYTHGYFYKCLERNTNPVTYIWEQINVQPKSKPTLVGETLVF